MAGEVTVKKDNFLENVKSYIGDVRGEMKRVTWPSRAQVESTTLVVILSVFAFAAYFRLVDFIINSTVVRGYTALTK
jgi:preprotein translocase subunit SecE